MRKYLRFFLSVCFMFVLSILFVCCGKQAETPDFTQEDFELEYTISATDVWYGDEIRVDVTFKKEKDVILFYDHVGDFFKWHLYNEDTSILSCTDTKYWQYCQLGYNEVHKTFNLKTVDFEPGEYYFTVYVDFEHKGEKFEFKSEEVKITIGWEEPSVGLDYTLSDNGEFYYVAGLGDCKDENVVIPSIYEKKEVIEILPSAFKDCVNIKTLRVHKNIRAIREFAFCGCTNLTTVMLPDGISIEGSAFKDCVNLDNISLGKDVYMSSASFADTAYYNNKENWEKGFLYIGEYLVGFDNAETSKVASIKEGTTKIVSDLFDLRNSIETIQIPSSVESFVDYHLLEGANLKNIYVDVNNPWFSSVDGNLYTKDGKKLIRYAKGKTETMFYIPNGVTHISDGAFESAKNLEYIELSTSVTQIGWYAFAYCEALEHVELSTSVTQIGNYAFTYCVQLKSIELPASVIEIGDFAFARCIKLEKIEIPNGVEKIAKGMFKNCYSLIEVVIPDSVTDILDYAFKYCDRLERFIIPDGVENISISAFEGCDNLREITLGKNLGYVDGISLFEGCKNLERIEVSEENRFNASVDGVLYNKYKSYLICYPQSKKDKTFLMPESVRIIGQHAFMGNEYLQSIKISQSVHTIEDSAFEGCGSLENIIIPESVHEIGINVFLDCKDLQMVTFENPNDWYLCGNMSGKVTPIQLIPEDYLKNEQKAAEYLSVNYVGFIWQCIQSKDVDEP